MDLGTCAWAWGGVHGLGAVCMGLGRCTWAWGGVHGLGEVCMGLGRCAWAWGGMHGLGEVCMGLGRHDSRAFLLMDKCRSLCNRFWFQSILNFTLP